MVPLAQAVFQLSGPAKHPNGTPAKAAPALKTSGYAPSRTLVIMPPEECPVTYTRFGSPPLCCSTYFTIETMPSESLPPLWVSEAGECTSQQPSLLLADG